MRAMRSETARTRKSLLSSVMAGGLLLGLAALNVSCGPSCRPAEYRELNVVCASTSSFTGEIHLDSAAAYDTFLSQECTPNSSPEALAEMIDDVDFDNDVVFVAVGPSALDNTRCLVSRELAGAEVCSDGLKIGFDDVLRASDTACPGTRWTVALAIGRADMRAALDAAETF